MILVVNNEEKFVQRCLESVKDLSDDIVVIHDGKCTDNSLKIAYGFTNKVFERQKYGALEPHLVEALYMVENDWILRLDTDEYLSDDLIEHISKLNLNDTRFTHFTAKWREWMGQNINKQSKYQEKIVLFNKRFNMCIGIPHHAVLPLGEGISLNGYLEHIPIHVNYGFKELVFRKIKPFALTDARLRLRPIEVYPSDCQDLIPKKIFFRNKYPILTLPLFSINIYLRTLTKIRTAKSFFLLKRIIIFSHAHMISQILLSYYLYKEKRSLKYKGKTSSNHSIIQHRVINIENSENVQIRDYSKEYDEDYFERGLTTGKSCYVNYHWMPELTIRMAYFMIKDLPIEEGSKILDFGCAKGYLVKAFRILTFEAYGVDISDYAISQVDRDVEHFCKLIKDTRDIKKAFNIERFDWLISKDVFEHIPESQLNCVLRELSAISKKMFVVIPLGKDDISGKFMISAYDKDGTHYTAKTDEWWRKLFQKNELTVERVSFTFRYCKENWTQVCPKGNAFYVLNTNNISTSP